MLASLGLALLGWSVDAPAAPRTPALRDAVQARAKSDLAAEAAHREEGVRDRQDAIASIRVHAFADPDHRLRRAREAAAQAREADIARLGPEASRSPEATLALARLHEEHAVDGPSVERAQRLAPAIALYEGFLARWSDHVEVARVRVDLARALDETERRASAAEVRRALVCRNHFGVPAQAIPSAYPADCAPIPGASAESQAEAWAAIGGADLAEGNDGRAESAFRRAMSFDAPRARAAARYGLAATLAHGQRREAALAEIVGLLRDLEAELARAGAPPPGASVQPAACGLLSDVLLQMEAAAKTPRAVDLVQDPAIIPANVRWARPVLEALAQRYEARGDLEAALRVNEIYLRRWPHDRHAPFVRHHLAEIHDAIAARLPEGSAERADAIERACDERLRLTASVGEGGWVSSERLDAGELAALEVLVVRSLRRAAADRTNVAMSLVEKAVSIADETRRNALLVRVAGVYGRAARDWSAYLALDMNGKDAAEVRYWIADAWHKRLRSEVALGGQPSAEELSSARSAVVSARDANRAGTYLQPAAWMVVDVAQLALDVQYGEHVRTHGAQGIAKREQVEVKMEREVPHPVEVPIPREVEDAIAARLVYLERVPPEADFADNRDLYAFQVADIYFLYGHFEEAKPAFRRLYPDRCGRSPLAYKALTRLIDMAAMEGDVSGWRALDRDLSAGKCLLMGAEPPRPPPPPRPPAPVDLSDGYQLFRKAENASPGPEKDRLWRLAAERYREAFDHGPARDEAPEAAINGAYAFKQIGAYAEAMDLYRRFVRSYGSEDILTRLQKRDPARHKERVGFIKQAEDALASAEVLSFDYGGAAVTFDEIAGNGRFEANARREAARNAVILHLALDQREAAGAAQRVHRSLSPAPAESASLAADVVRAALARWDEHAPDVGSNRAARLAALAEATRFFATHERVPGAEAAVVRAAHAAAKLRRAGRDPEAPAWCRKVVRAFERYRAAAKIVDGRSEALTSPEAELAAECAHAAIDTAIRADLGDGPRRYAGSAAAIERAFTADLARVERHARALRDLHASFGRNRWTVVASAQAVSLLDRCVRGLDHANARAPSLDRIRAEAEAKVVRGYIEAWLASEAIAADAPEIVSARRRLTALAATLGDAAMRSLSSGIIHPVGQRPFVYGDGMFASPPGLLADGRRDPLPLPLPVVP
ncbi:MAG: hypothetical protein QM820_42820 [Minicystis sp.]